MRGRGESGGGGSKDSRVGFGAFELAAEVKRLVLLFSPLIRFCLEIN